MRFIHLLLPLTLTPAAALAELSFCNDTGVGVSVAVGYSGPGDWTSEGWWNVEPGACAVAIPGDLDKSHYYYRVESLDVNFDHDSYMFCAADRAFTIVGDTGCEARGHRREGFNEIRTGGQASYTVSIGPGRDPEEDIIYPDEEVGHDSAASDVVMDPPGTHGEPYSITGILSHCDVFDAGMQCTVLSDGWLYTTDSYGPTPLPLLEEIMETGRNVPITIRGDLMDYAGAQANVTIRDYTLGYPDAYTVERDMMEGFWTSADDRTYQVLIHGSMFEEYYDGRPDMAAFMFYQWGCDSAFDGQIAFQLVSWDGNEQRCAAIEYVEPGRMSIWVAGTMRPLSFFRTQ